MSQCKPHPNPGPVELFPAYARDGKTEYVHSYHRSHSAAQDAAADYYGGRAPAKPHLCYLDRNGHAAPAWKESESAPVR
jgi:hypothetical protein